MVARGSQLRFNCAFLEVRVKLWIFRAQNNVVNSAGHAQHRLQAAVVS
jgi:hypothetical protein